LLTGNHLILLMNYLAHAYLSFNNADILAGNIISDFVKGKAKFDYPPNIQKGIHLHRLIDTFTDHHSATAIAKSFFRPQYRLYSGAFTDVVYDHFLARDEIQFQVYGSLENFSRHVYQSLEINFAIYPPRFQNMFPYMKSQDWLANYGLKEGIRNSFEGIVYRAAYLDESVIAFEIFNEYYTELKNCYEIFFPELKKFASDTMGNLLAW
jgi:acyl carrier protein phosphodiesterase